VNTNQNPAFTALQSVQIYTDGGCEPNPEPGGYGAVLIHPKKRKEVCGGFRKTTNNRNGRRMWICGGAWRRYARRIRWNSVGYAARRAIRKTGVAINSRWPRCASPIFRWTTVTRTRIHSQRWSNPRRFATAMASVRLKTFSLRKTD